MPISSKILCMQLKFMAETDQIKNGLIRRIFLPIFSFVFVFIPSALLIKCTLPEIDSACTPEKISTSSYFGILPEKTYSEP